jgi:AcrR family transcriptional regulator
MKRSKATPARGRPRAFDADRALDAALRVFWRKGYEGASLLDLTRAMRINRPSLYAAFGNKESLFLKALDRYVSGPAAYVQDALQAPTARAVVEKLLEGAITLLTDPKNPRGCLAVQGALACGKESEAVKHALASRRESGVRALAARFRRAVEEGDLADDVDAAALARYIAVMVHGLAVHAAGGASRQSLRQVADLALRAWP